jgi:hypothetical protein
VAVSVDVGLEARVAEAVAARRPILEQLVREAVDAELVDRELNAALERLAARNGTPPPADVADQARRIPLQ